MRAPKRIRVLIVSSYPPLRKALREILEQEGIEIVGEGCSARDALSLVRSLDPQVILMDEQLADGSADGVCRDLHEAGATASCLVLSSWHHRRPDDLPGTTVFALREIAGIDLPRRVREAARQHARRVLERARSANPPPPRTIHQAAVAVVEDLRTSGSYRQVVLAETWGPAVLKHAPASQDTSAPCAGCDAPSPCGLLLDVIANLH